MHAEAGGTQKSNLNRLAYITRSIGLDPNTHGVDSSGSIYSIVKDSRKLTSRSPGKGHLCSLTRYPRRVKDRVTNHGNGATVQRASSPAISPPSRIALIKGVRHIIGIGRPDRHAPGGSTSYARGRECYIVWCRSSLTSFRRGAVNRKFCPYRSCSNPADPSFAGSGIKRHNSIRHGPRGLSSNKHVNGC